MFKIFNASGLLALLLCVIFAGCRKEEFDKYYARPEGLAKPIYQQLDSMGNFKSFLACIEKAGYKNTLGAAGSWTVFAPTDEAFSAFMSENNITDISSISDSLAAQIVRTAMVYDGEKLEKLDDNFTKAGFVEDVAFRRRTVYYDFVETATSIPGHASKKYISTNSGSDVPYVGSENNNKYITYFFDSYMSARGLGASDYKAFYPESNYTGLNIAGAEIDPVKHDIVAENGIIHVVNKVLLPAKNIDQYLKGKSQYSVFKSILDGFVKYTYNEEVTHKYKVLTGNTDSVFTKSYSDIALALNNENFDKEDPNDAQVNNNSITVPTNAAVQDYARRVLLRYYPSGTTVLDLLTLNKSVLREYVNAHLYNGQLWPSKFNTQKNILGESPKIDNSNVVEIKLLSNGAFYGVNKSQQADVFHTVYGNVLLDPKYSIMSKALELEGYNLTLKIPTIRYMLVMVPDAVLNAAGFSYDTYYPSDPIRLNGASGRTVLRRILQQHIVPLDNYPIPDLSGKGMLETLFGDYIKYDNGHLISRGTLDNAAVSKPTFVSIDSTDVGVPNVAGPVNGIAVYADGPLTYSDKTIGTHLAEMIDSYNSIHGAGTHPYSKFFNYLTKSTAMYNTGTGEITGVSVGLNYTLLIPDNNAISAAVSAGLLPSSPTTSNQLEKDKITNFLKYHIVKNSFAIDGKKTGAFESLYKDLDENIYVVKVTSNTADLVILTDERGRNVETTLEDSNNLGDRILIHSLKSYLDYRKN